MLYNLLNQIAKQNAKKKYKNCKIDLGNNDYLSINLNFCTANLHPSFTNLVKKFKCETTSFHFFPKGFGISNIFGDLTLGSWGKKSFKRYLKSEHTHTQTYEQIDL